LKEFKQFYYDKIYTFFLNTYAAIQMRFFIQQKIKLVKQ